MKSSLPLALLNSLVMFCLLPSAAQAAEHDQGWQFEVTPYIFTTGLDGTIGVGGAEADVDASFSDLSDYIDKAFMMVAEARRGKWGIGFDGFYTKLKDEETNSWTCEPCLRNRGATLDIEITTTQEVYTLVAAYRLQEQGAIIDAFGGARYSRIENEVDLTLTPVVFPSREGKIDGDIDWWDPIVGIRLLYPFADNWTAMGYADVGVAGDSDSTYQAMLGLNWGFSQHFSAKLGYRYLYQDYEEDDVIWDITMEGVFLGLGIRF